MEKKNVTKVRKGSKGLRESCSAVRPGCVTFSVGLQSGTLAADWAFSLSRRTHTKYSLTTNMILESRRPTLGLVLFSCDWRDTKKKGLWLFETQSPSGRVTILSPADNTLRGWLRRHNHEQRQRKIIMVCVCVTIQLLLHSYSLYSYLTNACYFLSRSGQTLIICFKNHQW